MPSFCSGKLHVGSGVSSSNKLPQYASYSYRQREADELLTGPPVGQML